MRAPLVALLSLTLAPPALGAPEAKIAYHDLGGTAGQWQEGVVVVPASLERVHHWFTDFPRWSQYFPDISWTEVLPNDDRGRRVVRFHSRVGDKTFVLFEDVQPNLLVFECHAPRVRIQGRIYLLDAGQGNTRVIMQSTASVRGFFGLFATHSYRRNIAFKIMSSYLSALDALARRS